MSIVEGTEIRDNVVMTKEEFAAEVASCSTLCFIPPSFLANYNSQITTIHESQYQFSSILGNFKIGTGTTITGASALVKSYSGVIEFEGVSVTDSTLSRILLDLTATELRITGSTFSNINSLTNLHFI